MQNHTNCCAIITPKITIMFFLSSAATAAVDNVLCCYAPMLYALVSSLVLTHSAE